MRSLKYLIAALLLASCGGSEPGEEPAPTPAEAPSMAAFYFSPAHNPRLSSSVHMAINSDSTITGSLDEVCPIGENRMLKASFYVPKDQTVYVDGVKQTSGETENDFTKPVTYCVENADGVRAYYTTDITCFTGLPIVSIDTGGADILNKEDWVPATAEIVGGRRFNDISASVSIRGRGNSTWRYSKKPYALKFEKKTEVLGMPKHKRWVLLANYLDRTLMRNEIALHIGRNTPGLGWTPRGHFVELVLNGKHMGNYYLCEQIKVDSKRVDIREMSSTDISGEALTGGYLLELDTYYDEVNKFRSNKRNLPVNIKYPDEDILVNAQFEYIKNYFNQAEEVIYGSNFADPVSGYASVIDADSFADYYIICELIYHTELRHPKSTYVHKDIGGKLKAGPLWDFDWRTFTNTSEWVVNAESSCVWYMRLLEDPAFKKRVKSRWQAMYPFLQSVPDHMDEVRREIYASAMLNTVLWPNIPESPNDDKDKSYDEAAELMKSRYKQRLAWMNNQISQW